MSDGQGSLFAGASPALFGGAPAPTAERPERRPAGGTRAPRRIPSSEAFVAVPFVDGKLWRAVMGACERQAQQVFPHCIDADDLGGYARLLGELWTVPKTLIIVEQDVIPPAGSLMRLHRCRSTWCAVPYSVAGEPPRPWLGCTKLGVKLRRSHPNLCRQALITPHHPELPAIWTAVDMQLADALRVRGYRPCVHLPAAVHLHPYARL